MKLYSTHLGRKEDFHPIEGNSIRMYVCGITPYDDTHIGHAMSYIIFDMMRRYFEYKGYSVKYVQNFTDIDDKIINRSKSLGIPPDELVKKYIDGYLKCMDALNVKKADFYPLATQEIESIINLTNSLIEKGYAYVINGDVYFRVRSWDRYGFLSGRSLESMEAGSRIEIDNRKEDPMDFALWKSTKEGEPSWSSPWGKGRPGWHIECSAMVMKYLGEQIDIHGGGQDLIFPHHENEAAQSEAFSGKIPFVRYWVHNGLLKLGEEKMSKSLGNLITIENLLAKHRADALRLFVLSSHYRSPITYTEEALMAAEKGIDRIMSALGQIPQSYVDNNGDNQMDPELSSKLVKIKTEFIEAMDDDFGTPQAISRIFDLVREINRYMKMEYRKNYVIEAQKLLAELANILGFKLNEESKTQDLYSKPFIDLIVEVRTELRKIKQFSLADKIRDRLSNLGIILEDNVEGTKWRQE